ncbi:BioY family transporter [Lactococcus hodotermopsidis]|uniref:Biotin transporter n=1 Tax=Pseudolactococcus hodotermopsidis TaxID=2709157 RepID=A0A6A0BED4_9LACT|nr:biotin transporter BioY [Lactococcus hodotermopsidis]GFH42854.1 BioY family transporter [Lactococcus hodotermopsidis]
MTNNKIQRLAIIAISAAFLAVASQFTIPLPLVPLTLQTLAVGIIATILKPLDSVLAVLLYLILGAVGLPVFAGGAAGFGVLFGPTGGFLVGFLIQAALIAHLTRFDTLIKSGQKRLFWLIFINIIGTFCCLMIGTVQLVFVGKLLLHAAFKIGFLPFIIPGIVKAILAAMVGYACRRALKTMPYFATTKKTTS